MFFVLKKAQYIAVVKRYEEVLDSSRVLMRDKIIGKEVRIVSKEEALSSDFAFSSTVIIIQLLNIL